MDAPLVLAAVQLAEEPVQASSGQVRDQRQDD
jgi:hypothetical protein